MPSFPEFDLPAPGETTRLHEGVYWLRMPLPFALNHINLYLLEDTDGWFIVDTGLGGKTTEKHWRTLFDSALKGKPVKGIIATHMHPDHIGQAGFLNDHWKAPLYMTRGEYFGTRALSGPETGASRWSDAEHYRRAGVDEIQIEAAISAESGFGNFITPMPRSYQRLEHGATLKINGSEWRIIVGSGHSPEHACLFNETLNLLISGDQILPKITPNISVYSTEPNGNPLADYLGSLPQFLDLPEDVLTLPAHNFPFIGLHKRVRQMQEHHEEKLQALMAATSKAQTAIELLPVMFKRKLDGSQLMFALGECVAHLNYLMVQGDMERTLEGEQYKYRATRQVDAPANGANEELPVQPI